ncbi:MAG TPA: hypothetical protein ENK38_02055 [Gammaproteobacteria bacterium]|nr:hypothetical protein [Gammaproteobacteria bacterium]
MTEARQAAEILARLNPKVVDATEPGGGGGKVDTLSSSDIAAALSGVSRGPYLLALAKYAGDTDVLNELVRIVTARIRVKAKRKGWKPVHQQQYRHMAILALQEAEATPQVCRRCHGRNNGYIEIRKPKRQWILCPDCAGEGKWNRTDKSKARAIGVPFRDWRARWGQRQDVIRAMMIDWEWSAVQKMIRRLRRGE